MKKILLILSFIIYNISVFPQFGGADMFIIETDSARVDTTDQLIIKQNWIEFVQSYSMVTETDPIFTAWDKDYADLINKPTIPIASNAVYNSTTWNGNTNVPTKNAVRDKLESVISTLNTKQTTLVSGTNIKTVNSSSLLGSGDISTIQSTITGNAGTATSLQTGRYITNVYFDGTSDISLNNNAITNGANYTTSIIEQIKIDSILRTNIGFYSVRTGSGSYENGNVFKYGENTGIGTQTPTQKLDVSGGINADSIFINGVRLTQPDDVISIGDYYQGGIVYYVHPSGSFGYCAYSLPIGSAMDWTPAKTVTGATNTYIGSGIANTTTIVADQNGGDYAAYLCDTITLNGYTDWFLPSKDGMDSIYKNLQVTGLNTYPTTNFYWTSTENTIDNASYIVFSSGYIGTASKFSNLDVIAARKFTVSALYQTLSLNGTDLSISDGNTIDLSGLGGGATDPMTSVGDIIYRNSSNVTTRLAIGSTYKILTSYGGVPTWQTPSSVGITALTGDITASGTGSVATTISTDAVDISMLSASGTASSSTYLRGDNTWATPSGGINIWALKVDDGTAHSIDNGEIVNFRAGDNVTLEYSSIVWDHEITINATDDQDLTLTGSTLSIENGNSVVFGSMVTKGFWNGSQAQYDALGSYDSNTIYFINQ